MAHDGRRCSAVAATITAGTTITLTTTIRTRATTVAAIATVTVAAGTLVTAGLAVVGSRTLAVRQNFTLIQPGFDADNAISGVGFGESVIDIGAQSVQRKLTL
jgi:hypothetical protein